MDKKPSFRILMGLTALVFCMSDVRDGIGPFLSIYLKSTLNWDTEKTGMALAATSLAAAIIQLQGDLIFSKGWSLFAQGSGQVLVILSQGS